MPPNPPYINWTPPDLGPMYGPSAPQYGPFQPLVPNLPGGGGGGGGGGFNFAKPLSGIGGLRGFGGRLVGASPYAIAGTVGGGFAEQFGAPSEVGAGLQGAGLGATLGTAIAPGPGTLIGAVLGGLGGVALDIFGGEDEPDIPDAKDYTRAIKKFLPKLPAAARAEVNATMRVARVLPEEQRTEILFNTLQSIPSAIASNRQQKSNLKAQMRNQLAVGQMMAQLGQRNVDNVGAYNESLNQIIPTLPSEFQPVARMMGENATLNAQNMADAFTGSVMAQPVVAAMDAQLAQIRQMQQQAQAQGSNDFFAQVGG